MKKCPICNQTYTDESLNFCLNDGGTLTSISDDAPPTVFMNEPRSTNPSWSNNAPFTTPNYEQLSPWQNQNNQPNVQNPSYMASSPYQTEDKTLPTISLVLGILGVVFICCYGGIPFGIGAMITGYLGFNNTNKNPNQYGGRGFAIAGMIMGAISFAFVLILLFFGILGNIR